MKRTALISAWFACWDGCAYCGNDGPLTRDHVIPKSRGGRDAVQNFVPACGSCNKRKGDGDISDLSPKAQRRFAENLARALQRADERRLYDWPNSVAPAYEPARSPTRDPADACSNVYSPRARCCSGRLSTERTSENRPD